MIGAIPPLHQYAFMAWCLVKKVKKSFLGIPNQPGYFKELLS
jgi:hypothetical protein